jgi:dihydrofolate synthase / folylpolyglutamate synthase
MKITPVRTEIFRPHQELGTFIVSSLEGRRVPEKAIVVVTSKIVSLAEGRISNCPPDEKEKLVTAEADHYLGELGFGCRLTIKHGQLIPSAGIDESNCEGGGFILYPVDPFATARRLHTLLREKFHRRELGILLTDSRSIPLRHGVVGTALAHWGFGAVKSQVGRADLFGRPLKMTKVNLADSLAAAAVLMMGEADESSPLALIEDAPVDFTTHSSPGEIQVSPEEDIYFPLYSDRFGKR